jgi:hypothetical protein
MLSNPKQIRLREIAKQIDEITRAREDAFQAETKKLITLRNEQSRLNIEVTQDLRSKWQNSHG